MRYLIAAAGAPAILDRAVPRRAHLHCHCRVIRLARTCCVEGQAVLFPIGGCHWLIARFGPTSCLDLRAMLASEAFLLYFCSGPRWVLGPCMLLGGPSGEPARAKGECRAYRPSPL